MGLSKLTPMVVKAIPCWGTLFSAAVNVSRPSSSDLRVILFFFRRISRRWKRRPITLMCNPCGSDRGQPMGGELPLTPVSVGVRVVRRGGRAAREGASDAWLYLATSECEVTSGRGESRRDAAVCCCLYGGCGLALGEKKACHACQKSRTTALSASPLFGDGGPPFGWLPIFLFLSPSPSSHSLEPFSPSLSSLFPPPPPPNGYPESTFCCPSFISKLLDVVPSLAIAA